MKSNRAQEMKALIMQFLMGKASDEEVDELNRWIAARPENKRMFNEYLQAWQNAAAEPPNQAGRTGQAWQRVQQRMHSHESSTKVVWLRPWMRYAAMLVVLLGIGVVITQWMQWNQQPDSSAENKGRIVLEDGTVIPLHTKTGDISYDAGSGAILLNKDSLLVQQENSQHKGPQDQQQKRQMAYNTIYAPYGYYYQLTLPDGSKAWVNSGSELRYFSTMPSGERRVILKGEAYFDVEHNPALPFVVETQNIAIEVLGTEFNVKSFQDEDAIHTTLVSGKVQVKGTTSQGEPFTRAISPGQQAVFSKPDQAVQVADVDTERFCSWKDGYYTYWDAPFTEVMETMARYYGVDIALQGSPQTWEKKVSGKLIRNDSITVALENLKVLLPFNYQIQEDKIIIHAHSN